MKTKYLALTLLLSTAYTCSEQDNLSPEKNTSPALIRYTGPWESDGCGYVIDVNNKTFSPENLPDEFRKDSLYVSITYQYRNDSLICGDNNKGVFRKINLTEIKTCSKKEYAPDTTARARIRFTGLVAADGCGYVMDVNNRTFSPDNLPEEFQKDSLYVTVIYQYKNDSLICGFNNKGVFRKIKIIEIK